MVRDRSYQDVIKPAALLFSVAIASQYLAKCNREKTKCLNDISSKGFIAKEENGNLVEETGGYGNTGNVKFAKVESKSKAKLKIIEGVELVEEQIYEERVTKSRDANWADMWTVNGAVVPSMKVLEAWNLGYSGRGIYIAVVDTGIDIFHRDLIVNMRSSYHHDYVSNDRDPSPVGGETHGTNCAGLVGAEKDNNQCIAGIAYNANLVGIRLINVFGTTDVMEGNALSHEQSTIDIYTNSWGPKDGYGFGRMRTLTSAAIEKGIRTGRNGKGTIYVFAAGNGGLHDNCNTNAFARSIYTIAISSINSNGFSATYAEVCTPVLAVAYGGGGGTNKYLYSTSPMNLCTGKHDGTSFSAPQAAAIVALTLEANPDLTWRDVQHLIVRTSKKHDLLDRKYKWQINGANLSVHPVLGFGLMDAEAMVKTAQSWRSVPSQSTYTTLTQNPQSYISSWNTIPDVTEYITIDKYDTTIRFLEHVVVWIDFKSDSNGDIELHLTSPSGTTSYLLTPRPREVGNALSIGYSFMTVQNWGESPVGTWTLKMLLSCSICTATLHSWSITFYGTLNDPVYGNQSNTSNYPKPIASTSIHGAWSTNGPTTAWSTNGPTTAWSFNGPATAWSNNGPSTNWINNGPTNDIYYKNSASYAPRIVAIIAGTSCSGILLITLFVCMKSRTCSKSKVASTPRQAPSRPLPPTVHHPVWSISP